MTEIHSAASEHFFERSPWNNRWILFGIAMVVSCFDFMAGPVVFFPILFLIPVTLMAWNCGLRTALQLGAVLCVVRFAAQCSWGIPDPFYVAVLNAGLRLGILAFITFLVGKLGE
ncbi:MAG TPA: hypothetical protein VF585_05425, partial [Chthoniobacterales bacterium]